MNAGDFANSLYRSGGSGGGAGRSDPVFSKPPTAAQLQAKKASALAPYAPGPARTARSYFGEVQSQIHANKKYWKYRDGLGAQPRRQPFALVPNGTTAEQASQMAASAKESSAPNMSMYTSGQAQPRRQSFGTPYGQQQFNPQSFMLPGFGGGPQMRTVNFDGSVTRQPNFALRDAFAQNINSAMMPYYQNSGTYLGEGAPPPTWGQAPQFNFPQLYGQATNMVANGYQNPLAGLFG